MHCVYINLDRSTERRAQLEENFRANLKEDWTLTRFAAVDGDTEAALIAGTSTPPVKGCFESHRRVIDTFVLPGAPLLIFEDDARIGKLSCTLIDRLQTNLLSSMEWDLVFTDIGITAVGDMAKLVVIQERFIHYNQVKLIDLIEYNFFGTSSYIVNPASKKKL